MDKEKSLDAFIKKIGETELLLSKISEHIANHMGVSPDEVHWGHVGSASHVTTTLENLCEFMGISE